MGLRSTNDSEAAGIIEAELRAAIATLEAEVERLQRENGALARTYALAEETLRERTGEGERLRAALEGFVRATDQRLRPPKELMREARRLLDRSSC